MNYSEILSSYKEMKTWLENLNWNIPRWQQSWKRTFSRRVWDTSKWLSLPWKLFRDCLSGMDTQYSKNLKCWNQELGKFPDMLIFVAFALLCSLRVYNVRKFVSTPISPFLSLSFLWIVCLLLSPSALTLSPAATFQANPPWVMIQI